ncbi:MAG TPA: PD-(D/E)XK nuclease family protein, partial [Rhodanobacter sp.]
TALRAQGLATDAGADLRAVELTGACMRAALNAALPCGVRLCDVAPMQRRAEIEFHLSLAPARSAELMALLHAHGYQRQRGGVAPEHLCGLLTGKIDLTFAFDGCFHIVDWKTNRCAPYDDAALRAEIAAHDYDLQWLIYTLALHRWLRQQLRDYDYDRHVGEVYYLFVRGMHDGAGVHVDRPPRALVEAMDGLFTGDGSRP